MIVQKLNCWEFKKCGREKTAKEDGPGTCPVVTEKRLHQVHGGSQAGRACWVVAGTMCGGVKQGTFAAKYDNCEKCDFYQLVKSEEKANFLLSVLLLRQLKDSKAHVEGAVINPS